MKLLSEKTRLKFSQTDKKGNNSLHFACMGVSLKCARFIVLKLKEPNKLLMEKNKDGKTPIELL